MQVACRRLSGSSHVMYIFRTGAACARCQRWLSHKYAYKWATRPCAPAPRIAPVEPVPPPPSPLLRAGSALDDPHADDFMEYEVAPEPELGPEDDLAELEQAASATCTVSAARAKRRAWRAEVNTVTAANRDTARSAASSVAQTRSSLAHASHTFYTIGGIVFCAKCGSRAARQIRVSLLTSQCRERLTAHSRRDVIRLSRGQLPVRYDE